MKTLSLYSGAGGLDLGFTRAGADIVLACERDRHATSTLEAAFPGITVASDASALIPSLSPGSFDLIIGGPPCQGWSVAGKMDSADPRSQHVWVFLAALECVSPVAFVMENVDSIATLSKWQVARDMIMHKVSSLGYTASMVVLNAADFGVPQNRKRMFLIGFRDACLAATLSQRLDAFRSKGGTVRDVLARFGPAGSAGNPLTSRAVITYARNPILRATPYSGNLFNGAGRPLKLDAPAPTMAASAGGNKTHIVDERSMFECADGLPTSGFVEEYHAWLCSGGAPRAGTAPSHLRRLTIAESAAFQGFPVDYPFQGPRTAVYKQIGNAVPVGLARAVGQSVLGVL